MKLSVQELSPVKRALQIEVPREVVAEEFKSAYTDLNQRVRIPGFRPGKAPLPLLEKRYSATVEEDVARKLVSEYYRKALEESNLLPVDRPAIERLELRKDAPLTFTAVIEVKPAIALSAYAGLTVRRRRREVTDEDLQKTLEALQEQQAELAACPEDHAVVRNDFVVMDYEATVDGKPLPGGPRTGVTVEIGSGALIPGFEDQLVGLRRGETVGVSVTFPSDYRETALAGWPAEFQVTIREIKQKGLPPIDDELAKDLGPYENLEALKEKLRTDLKRRLDQEADRAAEQELLRQLKEQNQFDLPASMVEREREELRIRLEPKAAGLGPEEKKRLEDQLTALASERVQGQLILEAVAEREGLAVTEPELAQAVEQMGREMRLSVEDVKRLILRQDGSFDLLKHRLILEKASRLLLEKAVIQDEK
jgi:trigger factor